MRQRCSAVKSRLRRSQGQVANQWVDNLVNDKLKLASAVITVTTDYISSEIMEKVYTFFLFFSSIS
jgi:hypothetical protein